MGPFQAHGPSAGPAKASGLPEAHGPLMAPQSPWAPGSLYPPAPPLGGPERSYAHNYPQSIDRVKSIAYVYKTLHFGTSLHYT